MSSIIGAWQCKPHQRVILVGPRVITHRESHHTWGTLTLTFGDGTGRTLRTDTSITLDAHGRSSTNAIHACGAHCSRRCGRHHDLLRRAGHDGTTGAADAR